MRPAGSLDADAKRMKEFADLREEDGAIVMINLLRYRERAEYPAGFEADPCSGREAYQRYAALALQRVAAVGGRVLWMGNVRATVIAPEGERWDDVALLEYPSVKAFLDMVAHPEYQAAAAHRTAALEDSRLIATAATVFPFRE